jgi:hypothetical protein
MAQSSVRFGYDRMSPQQLSEAIDDLGLTVREFSRLAGVQEGRMIQWLHGEGQPSHATCLLAYLMTWPGVLEEATAYTNRVCFLNPQGRSKSDD